MRRLTKVILAVTALVVCFMPISAFASSDSLFNNECSNGGSSSVVCQEDGSTSNPLIGPNGLLLKISEIIALIAGVAAIIVILISGLSFITSGGDPAKAQRARGALIGALVGLAIIVLAEGIIGFVLSRV